MAITELRRPICIPVFLLLSLDILEFGTKELRLGVNYRHALRAQYTKTEIPGRNGVYAHRLKNEDVKFASIRALATEARNVLLEEIRAGNSISLKALWEHSSLSSVVSWRLCLHGGKQEPFGAVLGRPVKHYCAKFCWQTRHSLHEFHSLRYTHQLIVCFARLWCKRLRRQVTRLIKNNVLESVNHQQHSFNLI